MSNSLSNKSVHARGFPGVRKALGVAESYLTEPTRVGAFLMRRSLTAQKGVPIMVAPNTPTSRRNCGIAAG